AGSAGTPGRRHRQGAARGTHRPGTAQGARARRDAAAVPEARRPPAARAAGRAGRVETSGRERLGLAEAAISRRMSGAVGVVFFAMGLIWVISLGSYSSGDPVWFFKAGTVALPANFAGRVGSFVAEASYQVFGYSAWLVPIVVVVIGWNRFWCHKV